MLKAYVRLKTINMYQSQTTQVIFASLNLDQIEPR